MKIRLDTYLKAHLEESHSGARPRRNRDSQDREAVLADMLAEAEAAGDPMRYPNAKGRIGWRATPQLREYLKDLKADADADAEEEAM